MSFRFQVFDRTEEGVIASSHPLCLEINDLGKAITTFEVDILACHMSIEIASSKAGISKREIGVDLDSGVLDLSPYDGNLSDTVFDDCLDFCEFILNRITPHSDKAIKTIMTHARFTLSHILDIQPSDDLHIRCIKGKCRNLAAFVHSKCGGDEFRDISHIKYNAKTLEEVEERQYSSSEIERFLHLEDICSNYYGTLLSDVLGAETSLMVKISSDSYILHDPVTSGESHLMPLIDVVSELNKLYSSFQSLRFHEHRDVLDMMNGRNCEDEALIGRVRDRKPSLESSPHSISEAFADNKEIAGDILTFARLLECVLSGSIVEGKTVSLSFRDESILRMLDPELFGKRYVTPTVVFVNCDAFMRRYVRMLANHKTSPNVYMIESQAGYMARCLWKYSERPNTPARQNGVMCNILPPLSSSLQDLLRPSKKKNDDSGHHRLSLLLDKDKIKSPAILVSDYNGIFELSSGLSAPSMEQHRMCVRLMVEVDEEFEGDAPTITRNSDSGDIPLITISNTRELFDLQTEGVLHKVRSAAVRIMHDMETFRPKNERERKLAELITRCCEIAIEDVDRAKSNLDGS